MMNRNRLLSPTALIIAVLVCAVICLLPAIAAAEGHGIERMVAKDWKGMWGFEKRGFAECWLAGKHHQAARTLAELKRIEQQLGPQSTAAQQLQPMRAELRAIVNCQPTPKQLEECVSKFYEAPGNAHVLLGDALHSVILDLCEGGWSKGKPEVGH